MQLTELLYKLRSNSLTHLKPLNCLSASEFCFVNEVYCFLCKKKGGSLTSMRQLQVLIDMDERCKQWDSFLEISSNNFMFRLFMCILCVSNLTLHWISFLFFIIFKQLSTSKYQLSSFSQYAINITSTLLLILEQAKAISFQKYTKISYVISY